MEGSFSFAYYREFLQMAIARQFEVLSLGAYAERGDVRRIVILCHDLCFSADGVAEMAQIEAEVGATASYFVRLTSRDWNPLAPDHRILLREAARQGHEVGLHFHEANVHLGLDPNAATSVGWQKQVLEQALGVPVRSMSIHGSWTIYPDLDVFGFDHAGLPIENYEYERRFHDGFLFIQDSAAQMKLTPSGQEGVRMWPHEALDRADRVHLLQHPMWWTRDRDEALRRW